jgi:hypothetical protein
LPFADRISGLTYTPGMYASNSELAVLCKVLAEDFPGAYYAPHHRSYGFKAIESYAEMLDLGRDTGCPVREYGTSRSRKRRFQPDHREPSHSCSSLDQIR